MWNKLFTKIVDSSIWLEPDHVRLVWITMIAMKDQDGYVWLSSIGNVAQRARVTLDEARAAVKCLESPDTHNPDQEHDGRRIERVPDGWFVINAKKYDDIVRAEMLREMNRIRVERHRAKKRSETFGNAPVMDLKCSGNAIQTHSTDSGNTNTSPKRAHRASGDAHFDRFWSAYPKKENKPGALKAWKQLKPDPDAVMAGVEAWRKSERWAKGFIVAPAKFLRERRWEDQTSAQTVAVQYDGQDMI